jgi:exopolyphosphatase / guanosine-5'-triphosphate,3'-diphosphate pyrophosphatase
VRDSLRDVIAGAHAAGMELSAGGGRRLVGVGGSATVLAAMEQRLEEFRREAVDGAVVSRGAVSGWERRLWALPLEERRRVPGLPPSRADVILTGASLYAAMLEALGFEQVTVSARGLRHAVLEELR